MRKPHDLNGGRACWCKPDLRQVCPACDGEDDDYHPDTCWRCRGSGLVALYDETLPALIVHRDEP